MDLRHIPRIAIPRLPIPHPAILYLAIARIVIPHPAILQLVIPHLAVWCFARHTKTRSDQFRPVQEQFRSAQTGSDRFRSVQTGPDQVR